MKLLSSELYQRYLDDPLAMDAQVRAAFKIPEDKYYSVSVYPPHLAGRVTIERTRHVRSDKISKSNPS